MDSDDSRNVWSTPWLCDKQRKWRWALINQQNSGSFQTEYMRGGKKRRRRNSSFQAGLLYVITLWCHGRIMWCIHVMLQKWMETVGLVNRSLDRFGILFTGHKWVDFVFTRWCQLDTRHPSCEGDQRNDEREQVLDGSAAFFHSIFNLEPGHRLILLNRTEDRFANPR